MRPSANFSLDRHKDWWLEQQLGRGLENRVYALLASVCGCAILRPAERPSAGVGTIAGDDAMKPSAVVVATANMAAKFDCVFGSPSAPRRA